MYTCLYIYMYIHRYAHTHTHTHTHLHTFCCRKLHWFRIFLHIYVCVYIYVFVYMHTHMYIDIHTYVHIHIKTHTHIHTCTYILLSEATLVSFKLTFGLVKVERELAHIQYFDHLKRTKYVAIFVLKICDQLYILRVIFCFPFCLRPRMSHAGDKFRCCIVICV